jgi:exosome complex component RRP4
MIWIDGDDENADVAADALKMIEAKAQAGNLTEKIEKFIASKLPQCDDCDGDE